MLCPTALISLLLREPGRGWRWTNLSLLAHNLLLWAYNPAVPPGVAEGGVDSIKRRISRAEAVGTWLEAAGRVEWAGALAGSD